MSERNGFGSFFAGFLAGAIAGAVATILYTPNTGEETRSNLRDKKDDLIGKANITVDDAYKQAESAAKEARDRFETLATATRERAENITRRGQVILESQINNLKKNAEDTEEAEEEILMPNEEKASEAEPPEVPEVPEVQPSEETDAAAEA